MRRKLKRQIPGKPLADRYNWCQGPVPGRGPAVEKHYIRECIQYRAVTFTTIILLTVEYTHVFVTTRTYHHFIIVLKTIFATMHTAAASPSL